MKENNSGSILKLRVYNLNSLLNIRAPRMRENVENFFQFKYAFQILEGNEFLLHYFRIHPHPTH